MALPAFGRRNGSATSGTFGLYQSPLAVGGKCLSQLYKLKNEVEIFLRENKNNLHVQFHNEEFVVMLTYMADVIGHLNVMNLSLQGCDVTVSDVKDKLAGPTSRMGVWQARSEVGFTTSFPLLEKHLKMNGIDLHLEIVSAEFP